MPQLEKIIKRLQDLKIISTDEIGTLSVKQEYTGSITPRTVGPRMRLLVTQDFFKHLESYVDCIVQGYEKNIHKFYEKTNIQKTTIKNLSNAIIEEELTIERQAKISNEILKAINNLTDSSKRLYDIKNKLLELKKLNLLEIFPDILFIEVYQENISNKNTEEIENPYVLRFGFKTDLLKAFTGTPLSIELHSIEKQLIGFAHKWLKEQTAVDFLSPPISGCDYLNNVIIIDIFARDRSQLVCKTTENGMLEAHTIAIWKKSNNQYLLIDPSNSQYSNFLVKSIKEIVAEDGYDIEASNPEEDWFYRYTASNEAEKPGYSMPHDYPQRPRDCVDIAVKIGFELNFLQKNYIDLDLRSVAKIERLMRFKLSNSHDCAPYLLRSSIIYRLSHSSNAEERNNAYLQLMHQSPFFGKLKNK